jgi:O-antigen/teichoic acid export membrane protein
VGKEADSLGDTFAKRVAATSVKGSLFNIASSASTLALGFVRSVLLARLLAPEDFGVLALALFFLSLFDQLTDFGFGPALIHRQDRVEEAAATHFALSLARGVVAPAVALVAVPLLRTVYDLRVIGALLALTLVNLVRALNLTPSALMSKELDFRRLAVLDLVSSMSMTLVAVAMAWAGYGFWSLVGEQAAGVIARNIGIWGFCRPWRPRSRASWSMVKWYFQFGTHLLLSRGLSFLLNQFDDFWAASALGYTPGGLYSKAYEYAGYPRRAVANPVMDVFFPTYAKVQNDRSALSKTFFRVNSLVVRVGFLFSGAFALVAPQFVRLFPGEKWMPMVTTLRLMLVYTLFDPLIASAGNLVVAIGRPQLLARAKATQLAAFVPLVVLLARYYPPLARAAGGALGYPGIPAQGIDGIAIAANVMLLLGIAQIFWAVRPYVDFSLRRMFAWPLVSLALALATTYALERVAVFPTDWTAFLAKAALFSILYGGLLVLAEGKHYARVVRTVRNLLGRPDSESRES